IDPGGVDHRVDPPVFFHCAGDSPFDLLAVADVDVFEGHRGVGVLAIQYHGGSPLIGHRQRDCLSKPGGTSGDDGGSEFTHLLLPSRSVPCGHVCVFAYAVDESARGTSREEGHGDHLTSCATYHGGFRQLFGVVVTTLDPHIGSDPIEDLHGCEFVEDD